MTKIDKIRVQCVLQALPVAIAVFFIGQHIEAPLWATLATTVGWFMAVSMQQFNFMELNHEWWDREDWIKENWHRFEAEAQAVLGEHANKVRIGYSPTIKLIQSNWGNLASLLTVGFLIYLKA